MNVHTVTARSSATPRPALAEEVVMLGARLGTALRMEEEAERAGFAACRAGDHTTKNYFEKAALHAGDEVLALRGMIAATQAHTLPGAAIQIAEALTMVAILGDFINDTEHTYQAKATERALERLLHSALEVVDHHAELKVAETVSPSFSHPYMNPWADVARRIAAVQAEAAADLAADLAQAEAAEAPRLPRRAKAA